MIKADNIVYYHYHQEHSGFDSKFASIMSQNGNIQDEDSGECHDRTFKMGSLVGVSYL